MAKTITFTTKDVCEALGVAKHHLRSWTDKLEPFNKAATKERTARRFTLSDLNYLAIIDYLEQKFGISLCAIAKLERRLYDLVNAPSSDRDSSREFIFISFQDQTCFWLESELSISEGLILNAYDANIKINNYLGITPHQAEMQLGLAMVS